MKKIDKEYNSKTSYLNLNRIHMNHAVFHIHALAQDQLSHIIFCFSPLRKSNHLCTQHAKVINYIIHHQRNMHPYIPPTTRTCMHTGALCMHCINALVLSDA